MCARKPRAAELLVLVVAVTLLMAWSVCVGVVVESRLQRRLRALELERQTMVQQANGGFRVLQARVEALEREVARLATDLDVCHARAEDIWGALGVVARTVPGRARPPRIPERKRPRREQTSPFREQEDPCALQRPDARSR